MEHYALIVIVATENEYWAHIVYDLAREVLSDQALIRKAFKRRTAVKMTIWLGRTSEFFSPLQFLI